MARVPARRLSLSACERLFQELYKSPVWKSPTRVLDLVALTGLSETHIRNVLSRNLVMTQMTARVIAHGLRLDWDRIINEPPPTEPRSVEVVQPSAPSEEPSVRDWFAMSAMNAFLSSAPATLSAEQMQGFAISSYACADAMLEARDA